MKNTIKNGYSACAGICEAGWYGGVLVLDGRDKEFVKVPDGLSYEQRAAYARRWSELTFNPRRDIRLLLPVANGMQSRCLASAERLEGPLAPRESVATPTLAWIERRAGQWHLMLFENGDLRTVVSRNHVLRCPQIAKTAEGLVVAFERDATPSTTQVELVDHQGATLYRFPGRQPVLRAASDRIVLCCEQTTPNEVTLRLDVFAGAGEGKPTHTLCLQEGDYLLYADIAWSKEKQTLFVAAESTPRWGCGNQIGLHRTIPRTHAGQCSGDYGHRIRRITLMRDGELLPWIDVGAKQITIDLVDEGVTPGKHWYVVTAAVDTGHGPDNTGVCHASPYFVWKENSR